MAPPRRMLELFAGTGSAGRWGRAHGYEVISLDILRKAHATHTCDVLDFEYTMYPSTYFQLLWASPPCTAYSAARSTGGPRPLEAADRIVQRTLDIIEYFRPGLEVALLENPGTGLLKSRPIMRDVSYTMVDYCMFSCPEDTYLYRKRTSIFHVIGEPKPNHLCDGKCEGILAHPMKNQHAGTFGGVRNCSLNKKHKVPQKLIEYLLA